MATFTVILGDPPYSKERVCATERALAEDQIVAQAEVREMKDLIQWVLESDRVVCFRRLTCC